MALVSWLLAQNGDWSVGTNWDSQVSPGSADQAVIGVPGYYQVSITTAVSVAGVSLSDASATLLISGAGTLRDSADFAAGGSLQLDTGYGDGGSVGTIAGTLTDTGSVTIGSNALAAAVSLTAGALSGPGTVSITGTGTNQASLAVGSAAPTTLSFSVSLSGDARLQYATGSIAAIAAGATLSLTGAGIVADAGSPATNSALTGLASVAGTLELEYGAALAVTGDLSDSGIIDVDTAYGAAGSTLTVGGTLSDSGALNIGSGSLAGAVTVRAGNLAETGALTIDGNGTNQAALLVGAAAPMSLSTSVTLNGDALLQYASGQVTSITSTGHLTLDGNARVADAGAATTNSALTGLASVAGTLELEYGAALAVTGDLSDSGIIDVDTAYSAAGSTLTVGGTLSDSGALNIGSGSLAGAVTVRAGNLAETGALTIDGNGTNQAALLVGAAAPVSLSTSVTLNGDALLQYASGQVTSITSTGHLTLDGNARVADAGAATTNSALTALASVAGTLELEYGAALAVTGDLSDSGIIDVDTAYGAAGSTLTVGGTLSDSGALNIGSGSLAGAVTVRVGNLAETGALTIDGNGTNQAALLVGAAAPVSLSTSITLNGDALLQYASGQVTSITNTGALTLDGNARVADAGGSASNSALMGLTSVAGSLSLQDGATVSASGDLSDTGTISVDTDYSAGGSMLTVSGTLTDSGALDIGSGSLNGPAIVTVAIFAGPGTLTIDGNGTNQAELLVGAPAPVSLSTSITLNGDALLQYASGQVTSITSTGALTLIGGARVSDAGAATSSSALTGLAAVAGTLELDYGAALSVTGDLSDTGAVRVDDFYAAGNSTLTVGGTLTDSGTLTIGSGSILGPAVVTVGALAGAGALTIDGDTDTGSSLGIAGNGMMTQASLIVTSMAGPALSNSVTLNGDALLQYAGGQVTSITGTGALTLNGNARVADAGMAATNSALDALASVAGALTLEDGAAVSVAGDLSDSGTIAIDTYYAAGGSALTVGGTLSDSGTLDIGSGSLSGSTTVTTGHFADTGALTIDGNGTNQAALVSGDAAPVSLSTSITLNGNALLQYASGQVTSIAGTGSLILNGDARLADAGAAATNSALTGLTTVIGSLQIENGAAVSVAGGLAISGLVSIDNYYAAGGSTLTVANALTDSGTLTIGSGSLSGAAMVTAGSLGVTGSLNLAGNASAAASLQVLGAASVSGSVTLGTNASLVAAGPYQQTGGSISLDAATLQASSASLAAGVSLSGSGTVAAALDNAGITTAIGGLLRITGPVTGSGQLSIDANATLELGAATAQQVTFSGTGATLRLDQPASFTGLIAGLAIGDTIGLANTSVAGATATYDSASGTSALTITLAGGGTLSETLSGNYGGDTFAAFQVGAQGDISFLVPAVAQVNTASPVTFAPVHQGTVETAPVSITNAAGTGAPALDASIASVSGSATGAGTITQLAPGATNSAAITVGLDTAAAGNLSGTVTLGLASDTSGNKTPLTPQAIAVSGTVYREAAAGITVTPDYLHVGDPGAASLVVTNTDPADGFSESLNETVTGASGAIAVPVGASAMVAPGASSNPVAIAVSTQAAGQIHGAVDVTLQSVATGADPLGTTNLGPSVIPVTVYVDNYAAAALAETAGGGTLSQSGAATTIDLGTIEANSGPLTVGLAAINSASGQADELSGSFAASGSGGFTASGLTAFAGLGAGQQDAAPAVTLDTSQLGMQSETITLSPQDTNPGGYDAALPAETLTVQAIVAVLPPPVISAPATLAVTASIPVIIGPLTVSDPNVVTRPVTVTVSDADGQLAATAAGAATVTGEGGTALVLTGSIADINATLASLTYTDPKPGTDTITVTTTDEHRASASQSIAVTAGPVPQTGVVINQPAFETAVLGQQNGLAGLSISDPSDEANGTVLTLTLNSAIGTLGVNNPPGGAVITGQGTNSVTLTGTVEQINASLADDGFFEAIVAPIDLIAYLASVAKHTVSQALLNYIITGGVGTPLAKEDLVSSLGGPGGKLFSLGVTLASFELNSITAAVVGSEPPSIPEFMAAIAGIYTDAHIIEPDGTLLDFNPAGDFVFALSSQTGDDLDVQVRLQPLGNSQSASIVTQAAAGLGNDRVTFAVGRADTVWVNGAAVSLTLNAPDLLSGGTLTQLNANTYSIVWNTGEQLTVIDSGTYLNVEVTPGPNDTPGSIVGLASLATGGDLQLPDGTVLTPPITSAELYQAFAIAWQVPQEDSLLDYGPGQTTATFDDDSFPQAPITLADIPASVVAAAAAVAEAAGITDPGALAAAEFDYIASGGDTQFVEDDATLLAGRSTAPVTVTPSGPVPVALGVLPATAKVMGDGTNPIDALFDVYLTAASTTDTTVSYAVTAGGAGFLTAADFGGTLPAGTIVIPAGQTTGQISIAVPAAALGASPSEELALAVSASAGVSVFTGTAQERLSQPVAGPAPVPQISALQRLGTFTQEGQSYTLDLGDVQYGEPLPDILFSVGNAATGDADALGGTFAVSSSDGFTVTGASLPATLAAGQSYDGLKVAVDYSKLGEDTQTITFTPLDSNASGFSAPLPVQTLTIEDNIVVPTMVFSYAWGDVHIITYNGTLYDFQEVGEFTLAKSATAGDSFDIQLRLQPWHTSAVVSVITQVAVSVGTDRVTFDDTRPGLLQVDGVASPLSAADPTIQLDGGTLNYIAGNVVQIKWDTGEEATLTATGAGYINVSDGIPLSQPGSYSGLQGEDEGTANDFQTSGGDVLAQPLTYNQLHFEFADSWRVSQAAALFDYLPGQTTQTFTDEDFPENVVQPTSAPAAAQAQAAALVTAAGITDAGLAAAAEEDYVATGNATFVSAGAAVQSVLAVTVPVTPTAPPAPATLAGVDAVVSQVTEAASAATPVAFTVFLTQAATTDTTVNYQVVDGGAGFLGAAAFGGTLPSGSIVVTAGQTQAALTIAVPQNALAAAPMAQLEVQITGTSGPQIYTPTASVTIANNQRVAGAAAIPMLADLSDPAALLQTSPTSYTLNLGSLGQNAPAVLQHLAVENAAAAGGDSLSGTFSAPLGAGFLVTGDILTSLLTPGASYTGLDVTAQTTGTGSQTVTLVFTPVDVNASGYNAPLAPITLTVTDDVGAMAAAALDSPDEILFPNVHAGTPDMQAITIANVAAAPAQALDVTTETGGSAIATGSITGLAAGQTDKTDLAVGLTTTQAGLLNGIVLLAASSANGVTGGSTALPQSPTVDVFGSAYREAAAAIPAVALLLHVGDPGTATLDVTNTAIADGYSENLIASLAGATGGITAPAAMTAAIAPGASDTATLQISFSTATAGTVSGTVNVALTSDGGTGSCSVDGLGQTALAADPVAVTVTVNNDAKAAFTSGGAAVAAGPAANTYVLDLGTVQQGSTPVTTGFAVQNSASGPADLLAGSLAVAGSSALSVTGQSAFSGLAAGASDTAPSVTLATGTAGAFSTVVTLTPTGSNASGYSASLAPETLIIEGMVQGAQSSITIAGTRAGQATADTSSLAPFLTATVTDTAVAAVTVTVTPSAAVNGVLSDPASDGDGSSVSAVTGAYTVTGTAASVTADLEGLIFTPTAHEAAPGGTVTTNFTIAASDGTATANDSLTSVIATAAPLAASTPPAVSSPSLTVAENAAATAIGIAAPTDASYSANQLTIAVTALPTDGSVSLADGTAVSAGQALSSAQLTALRFTPAAGVFGVSSKLAYTVTDPLGNASAAAATLAVGPALGAPVTTPGTLTVAPGQGATALGLQAPTDPNYAAAALQVTVTALPADGSIDLAGGTAPITVGQVLSVSQLTSLTFLAATGTSATQSGFTYTVADPAGNASAGAFTLAIASGAAVTPPSGVSTTGSTPVPPPSAPVLAPVLAPGNLLSDVQTPVLAGTAAPGSLVTIMSNGVAVATATATAGGAFTAIPASPLAGGADVITATAATTGGVSGVSASVDRFQTPDQVSGISIADDSTRDVVNALGQSFGLDISPGTQAVQLLDGTVSVSPATNEGYLARLYEGLFGRGPDPATGYADDEFAEGYSHAQVAVQFLATPEGIADYAGTSNGVFVADLAQGFLGRSFSASDQAAMTNLLNAGVTRGAVLEGIADSGESQSFLSVATSDVFIPRPAAAAVYQMYETGLARDGELTGVHYATNEVLQKTGLSLLQVAQQIATTPEFLADHASQSNAAYVASLYQNGLGRAPDPAGAAMVTALDTGQITRAAALYGVATSPEAAANLTRLLP